MSPVVVNGLLFVGGVLALYFGAEWVVRGSARLAASYGVSPIVVGLTIVSLGTSAPELVVGVAAAIRGSGDLAVGNVLGSNLANMGLILGTAGLIRPFSISPAVVRREIPIMLVITALVFPIVLNSQVGRLEGGFLVLVLAAYIGFVLWAASGQPAPVEAGYAVPEKAAGPEAAGHPLRHLVVVTVGLAVLAGGAQATVESALFFAQRFGVPELVVGLTVVAVGTSLPELATSAVAAFRQEADLAVGNVVGSNIFNLTGILGAAAVASPLAVGPSVPRVELPAVFAFSLLLLPIIRPGLRVRRLEGAILLSAYVGVGALIL